MLTLPSDHRAADSRPRRAAIVRVCSCGAAFADVPALEIHLDESGDGDAHVEMAFDVNTLVRLGIRRFRIQRGLSMYQMAELLGVHVSGVSRIESGKRNAIGWGRTPRTVATLLGIDVPELLRVCEHCQYRPSTGYQCQWCGMPSAQ
jgi:DNA-binding XRE family transcriptional regulator